MIALPSARIVLALGGPVSTSRSDVDWVVTEHGACSLRGLSESERTRALLGIAGQARTESLQREAALS
jgi:acyl-CoA hydrolase